MKKNPPSIGGPGSHFPRKTAREKALALIQRRQPTHSLPRECYLDPDHYRQGLEQIWYRYWIFAGHTIEIKSPGQYITLQVGDYPLVIIRDLKGQV